MHRLGVYLGDAEARAAVVKLHKAASKVGVFASQHLGRADVARNLLVYEFEIVKRFVILVDPQ